MKRIFDLLASTLGLLLLSPFLLVVAVLIKIRMPGPVFYRAKRVGKDHCHFRLFKFRSMEVGADRMGPKITANNDTRITRFGRWIRKYKIDELPQLINVIKGEMSLVGPRPEDPAYVIHYSPEAEQLLKVLPGITSPASLNNYYEEHILDRPDGEAVYVAEVLPDKLQIELDYIQNRSFWSDIVIIFRTILMVVRPHPLKNPGNR